jgi:GNAT superfamily N-acetyltransferase
MEESRLRELPADCKPLMDKFYRAHKSHMRVPAGARCWVAGQDGEINAGLCLQVIADGHWLTGLLVSPARRNQGLASELLAYARARNAGPIWLFCSPQLIVFYERLGFRTALALPEPLADRLLRYNQSKTLVALVAENEESGCPKDLSSSQPPAC